MDRKDESAQSWVRENSGLPCILCDSLLAEETRPRCEITKEGLLLILRGVNMNPGADPEDMVSIRLWSDGRRVISLRGAKVLAVADVEERLRVGRTFTGPGDLVAFLASRLINRMNPVIDNLQEGLDEIEEALLGKDASGIRSNLSDIRRQAVAIRRYLYPQKDVLARISIENIPWITEMDRSHLREATDRITRHVEDLDEIRERAAVTQEELLARSQERLNRNTYLLSLVAAVFLPLGFVTGLLGINVGGIPGTDSSSAFLIVCLALCSVALFELIFFYWKRWF